MKLIYRIGLSMFLIAGITSCIDDAIVENNVSTWQEGDTPYYINLKLQTNNDSFTRADRDFTDESPGSGFEDGSHYNEHAIGPNGNFAIFFDANKNYIACADLYSVNETEVGTEDKTDDNGNITEEGSMQKPNPEAIYSCRFYGFAEKEPKYILVVVNASDKVYNQITAFPGYTLDEVYKCIWEEVGRYSESDDPYGHLGLREDADGTTYFTMTNTTYVENAGTENASVHCAEIIPAEKDEVKYITTIQNDDELKKLTPVTIYLERMVAKCQLKEIKFEHNQFIPTNAQPLDVIRYEDDGVTFTTTERKWGVQVLGWGMNGLETQSHLFKNVEPSGDWLTKQGWNSVYNKRCYWSMDPHYEKDYTGTVVYPWQYDDAKDHYDRDTQEWYSHFQSYDDTDKTFALTYYPFDSFCKDFDADIAGYFANSYQYNHTGEPVYIPENTFKPGMTIDRSRASRAYELAGSHVLVASRLLIDEGDGYQPLTNKNLYRNRVGVSYLDEFSLLVDFINAVNYKLNSQKYLYYKYYDWNGKASDKEGYRGHTIRARSEGGYALYCYFPADVVGNTTIKDLVTDAFGEGADQSNGIIIELTPDLIKLLNEDTGHFQLYKEADAINADGKVIPWIMYRNDSSGKFEQLRLMILERQPGDAENNDYKRFLKIYYYEGNSNAGAEFILGSPDEEPVKKYLSGTQGNKVGLSTWLSDVSFEHFKVTGGQGFSDDFSQDLRSNWKVGKEAVTNSQKGNWSITNGQLRQSNTNVDGEILIVDTQTFPRSYTIEVDATVNDGSNEGFLIVFNYLDENNYCWWNVGGWGNTQHALEVVKNGMKTQYDWYMGKLEYNRKYNVKVRVNGNNVKCYLDRTLIHDVILPIGREIQYEVMEYSDGDPVDYTGDDNDVQSIFFEIWGVADCFTNGLMYYAQPVYAQDSGSPATNYRAIDYNATLETNRNEDYDSEELKYYYGVVRNNWYQFTLNSIKDIGIPVQNPFKPIVPNYVNKKDQTKMEMEILQWHIEDQTVEIPFN